MNIVFMGTPEFAVPSLEILNEHHEVSLVVTQEDKKKGRGKKLLPSPVKEKALELGLEVFQPEKINEQDSIDYIKSFKPDLLVVIAYGQILNEEILNIAKYYPINIHASILPKLRGAAPINRSIINGDTFTGVSIMKMEKGLDTGDVALISKTEIGRKNALELEEELSKMGAELILEFIKNLEDNNINFTKQDDNLSTYAEKIDKTTGFIDFNKMNSKEIDNLVRGLNDRMAASTTYKNERFKILEISFVDLDSNKKAGEIIDSKKKLYVKTLDGVISIDKLQFPGKKAMDIKSFLAGNSFEEGEILGG